MNTFDKVFVKIIFLIEWILFCIISFLKGKIVTISNVIFVILLPLTILYLIAYGLIQLYNKKVVLNNRTIILILTFLVAVERAINWLVIKNVELNKKISLFKGINITNIQSFQSYIFRNLNIHLDRKLYLTISILLLIVVIIFYINYVKMNRKSLLIQLSMIFLVAGIICFILSELFYGYVLDFFNLDGVITIAILDLYIELGVSALVAELFTYYYLNKKQLEEAC